jgi:hypothetical protein
LTLLVGVATRKGVWIGADSGSVAADFAVTIPDPKVWNTGAGWIVAGCGDWRAIELLRHAVEWPAPPPAVYDAHRTISIEVVDEIRKAFDQRGYEDEQDEDGIPKWSALVGFRTSASRVPLLFALENDHPEQHRAITDGLGEEYALGVLSQNAHLDPEKRVRATLAATRAHYGAIRPPFRVEAL